MQFRIKNGKEATVWAIGLYVIALAFFMQFYLPDWLFSYFLGAAVVVSLLDLCVYIFFRRVIFHYINSHFLSDNVRVKVQQFVVKGFRSKKWLKAQTIQKT